MQLITYTGVKPDYGVGLVVGVGLGAALVTWRRHDVRWEACDDARELGRHIAGAVLMGVGGVFAMGCTIGQGVSAASLLAVSAPVAMLSVRSEEHTSELQSLMRTSYAVFRLKKKQTTN